MSFVDYVGYFAALVTTVASLPQLIKILKTKSAEDISVWMFVFYAIGSVSWFTYGLGTGALPIVLTNIATFSVSIAIIFLKFKYKNSSKCPEKEAVRV